eukprot:375402-Alexandrium_andersonii.AAC.1
MSASLVGSEMCIRDSQAPVWRGLAYIWGFSATSKGAALTMSPMSVTDLPVSYTHLTLPTICSV